MYLCINYILYCMIYYDVIIKIWIPIKAYFIQLKNLYKY